jgi:hypothetical protein
MVLFIEGSRGWLAGLNELPSLALGLAIVVSLAGAVYSASLVVLWLVSGRPDGPEAKAIALLSRYLRKFSGSYTNPF